MKNLPCLLSSPLLMAVLASLELVLGFVLLSFPYLLGASAVWVLGLVFVALAVIRLLECISYAGKRLWNLMAALLYAALGVLMIFFTNSSLEIWTLFIGISLMIAGILRLALAFAMRGTAGSAWRFFNSLVSLALGILVVWEWPSSSLWLIGSIIAVEMIFSGWTLLFMALAPRSCSRKSA